REALLAALERCSEDGALEAAYSPALEEDLNHVNAVLALSKARDWEGARHALKAYIYPRLGSSRGADIAAREAAKTLRDEAKEICRSLESRCFAFGIEDYRADCELMREPLRALFYAVERYSQNLRELKKQRRAFEFSDLERLCLKLLKAEDGRPSAAARELAERYEHILVDEYQDTNELQDAIFSLVSRGEKNLFLVGDVKQSIYGFRRAEPEIFAARSRRCYAAGSGLFPAKISLKENFRSAKNVIEACNAVFSPIMSERNGGADYAAEGGLLAGPCAAEGEGAGLGILLTEAGGEASQEETAAALIAKMLKERAEIEEGGRRRPCVPEDFCILLRSAKGRAADYIKALENAGLRAWGDGAGDIFSSSEVQVLLALLKVLDNPKRELELAALMLSPLFDFTEDELLLLRKKNKAASLSALVFSERGGKIERLQNEIKRLRSRAACLGAGELVWECIESLDADLLLCAGEDFSLRLENLRELAAMAEALKGSSDDTLSGFLRVCERAAKSGYGSSRAFSPPKGAVCVCTVHKAKGLEWPVVIVADAGKPFNRADSRDEALLMDAKLGAGARVKLPCGDGGALYAHKTAHYLALSLLASRRSSSEELRLSYVALTRAKSRLFVIGALAGGEKKLAALSALCSRSKPGEYAVESASSPLERLLLATLCSLEPGAAEGVYSGKKAECGPISVSLAQTEGEEPSLEEAAEHPAANPEKAAEIRRRIDFKYEYAPLSLAPAKLAVTELSEAPGGAAYRPAFARKSADAARRGTAVHLFMQSADYALAAQSVEKELERLVEREYISREDARLIDLKELEGLFSSPLGARLAKADKLLREFEFISFIKAGDICELPASLADERVCIQGIADCVLIEKGAATLLDYKTDRVSDSSELRERYAAQLRLYKAALAPRLKERIGRCIVYSFALGREVDMGF
ncbi:MAG: UvrD-helicase domain-containing protein, partial [Oscillospiraceae bacterium]|nr:UvrD-helicase domain-containing protein [Oscillospiraceae bacterium]